MYSYIWTIIYIIVIVWLIARLMAWLCQWLLQKYADVSVKIGTVGFFSCRKVQIIVKKGLSIEIDRAWLSSCFVNQEIKKPLVICIEDIRIQADVRKDCEQPGRTTSSTPSFKNKSGEKTLPKIAKYAQYVGLNITNLTVMFLNTMIPDSLVHLKSQNLTVDISLIEQSYQLTLEIGELNCRALRSVSEHEEQIEPCLAELSWSTFIHLQVKQQNIKQIKCLRVLITKPQAMITEALLTRLQDMRNNPVLSPQEVVRQVQETNDEDVSQFDWNNVPEEIGIDVTELVVKIVREARQRTLSVGLKMFHIEYHKHSDLSDAGDESICGLLIEDFHTESPQAKFAELLKLNSKVMIHQEDIRGDIGVHGIFFHYHHDEVQYWTSVMSRISSRDNIPPLAVSCDTSNVQPKSSIKMQLVEFLQSKKLMAVIELTEMSSAVSSAACTGFFMCIQHTKLSGTVKPGLSDEQHSSMLLSHDVSCEFELQTVTCQHSDAQVPIDQLCGNKHFWDHVIYVDTFMFKMKKLGKEVSIESMCCNTQLEWSTNTLNSLLHFIGTYTRTRRGSGRSLSSQAVLPTSSQSELGQLIVTFKFDASNINLFLCNNHKVGLMARLDSLDIDQRHPQSSLVLEGFKVMYITQTDKHISLVRSSELHHPVIHIQEVRANFKHKQQEINVHVIKTVSCVWETCHHMCIIQVIEDFKELKNKLNIHQTEKKKSNIEQRPRINVIIKAETSLTIQLSKQHRTALLTDELIMQYSTEELLMELKMLTIKCDEHNIIELKDILFGSLSDCHLEQERKFSGGLTLATNRAWNINFNEFLVNFPYAYDFADCFEQFVNWFKWLKLVHNVKKKEFTAESRLPPDLRIKAKLFQVQLNDDPFEVKLADNSALLKDECSEDFKRRNVLDQKIQNLRKQHGIIPAHRVKELYESLARRSSEIYIQRSKQLYTTSPMRSKLFTWSWEDLEILAFADSSFHGTENVVKTMREIDKDSPFPEEGIEFVTLWCRMVNFNVGLWTVTMRDYPQPLLEVKDMHLWGRLIGAEQNGTKRAKRTCNVEVAEPWGNMTVERNLPALKFYHDFSCDVKSWIMAYGACWESAIAQYNISLDLINKPSIDPSRPLPIWDKIRLLLHGRLTMSVEQMSWLYLASFDPYNTTEMMDWFWSNVILDWTNAKFKLKGDFDIFVRTASKYDDCKLLHLPNLNLCIKLEWLSLGDPNDHHTVMPCAPDKVPDYSMEEHDSFRAFRSQNLNLDMILDTKPQRDNTLNIPSYNFYASTLRFLDKFKDCLASVSRPIRRGPYFNNTKAKKPQLTRHYKTIKMSVNLHRFNICYWMSFSKQHGSELLADSFVLHMCNDLTLLPVEDGLFHRPVANWSVRYLNCDLSAAKTWLCSAKLDPSDEMNLSFRNPVEKSFFISVARVSYQRGDITDSIDEDQIKDNTKSTHNVFVYDMKGAWTKHNRSVLLGLYDSYQKAQSLKRNLSSDALKAFKVDGGQGTGRSKSSSINTGPPSSPTASSPSPMSKLQTGHAYSMLMKLVAESDSKSVAFTEEPSSANVEQLHGVASCQTDDVIQKNWQIELYNSQMILKGVETSGHVIVSAAKAQILSCTHNPVWRDNQLRSKTTWVGSVECMQYYATVDPGHDFDDDHMSWLQQENVEDRSEKELSEVSEMVGSGHSAGGVVYSTKGGSKKKASKDAIQLQRIISRCKCQIFYASYGEVDLDLVPEVPLPPSEDSDVMMSKEEGVDTFTLLHHDLNICTNSLQHAMILDIVNNLLLHVEQKKKETTEKLQSMRFQLQLSTAEDQKTPILQLQEHVRQHCETLRQLERELYMMHKSLEDDDEDNQSFLNEIEAVEKQLCDCKEQINSLNEELALRISCFKESQLQVKSQLKATKAQLGQVDRRNEVCFKFAQWRFTEPDGQLGITDVALRNFVYSKVNRDNDTWSHQLELGWIKMTNLLPNSIYKDVLLPRDPLGRESENRQMALRILCTERPPVGGIAVKEHFEVNLASFQIQLTYKFFKKMTEFFFPDKNIETDEQQDDELDGAGISKKKLEKKPSFRDKKDTVKKVPSNSNFDDIDKMKERAANNNTFVYVKVPEVSLRVSYKGEKEKNIEDIHDFSLVLPTMEYHNSIWTWFDLLMVMKNDCKRIVLTQAIKQKLHMKSRAGDDVVVTDVQQEEDKMKMLLGAKLLAGQEKPVKKSLFGKSQNK